MHAQRVRAALRGPGRVVATAGVRAPATAHGTATTIGHGRTPSEYR
ncbi:hypothetical protein [Streptomyces sp. NPDC001480]